MPGTGSAFAGVFHTATSLVGTRGPAGADVFDWQPPSATSKRSAAQARVGLQDWKNSARIASPSPYRRTKSSPARPRYQLATTTSRKASGNKSRGRVRCSDGSALLLAHFLD